MSKKSNVIPFPSRKPRIIEKEGYMSIPFTEMLVEEDGEEIFECEAYIPDNCTFVQFCLSEPLEGHDWECVLVRIDDDI